LTLSMVEATGAAGAAGACAAWAKAPPARDAMAIAKICFFINISLIRKAVKQNNGIVENWRCGYSRNSLVFQGFTNAFGA
jgi:hypothetical protein